MSRKRNIAAEILKGLEDASAYLAGRKKRGRATKGGVTLAYFAGGVDVPTAGSGASLTPSTAKFMRYVALPSRSGMIF